MDNLHCVGFWRRCFAALLVQLIMFSFGSVSILAVIYMFGPDDNLQILDNEILLRIIGYSSYTLYSAVFESSSQQATLGKQMMRILVIGMDGKRITFPRAVTRRLLSYLSIIMFGFGYIMVFLNKTKQTGHDILAQTLVVRKSDV